MILYWDTSALIKLYIQEEHSGQARAAFHAADAHACSIIGYVEFHTAVARLHRESVLTDGEFSTLKEDFAESWPHYIRIPASQALLTRAAELGEAFALRAYDSVHLAAADMVAKKTSESIFFACYDASLNRAARILGFGLIEA